MLAYTVEKLLTQRAVIERDEGTNDSFGGEVKAKREIIGTVPCRYWWWREMGGRSPAKEFATPTRTIEFTGGGIIVSPGTDVEAGDHIARVEDPEGNLVIAGPLRVVAKEEWPEQVQLALMRP